MPGRSRAAPRSSSASCRSGLRRRARRVPRVAGPARVQRPGRPRTSASSPRVFPALRRWPRLGGRRPPATSATAPTARSASCSSASPRGSRWCSCSTTCTGPTRRRSSSLGAPAAPPAARAACCWRSRSGPRQADRRARRRDRARATATGVLTRITLGPLSPADARELVGADRDRAGRARCTRRAAATRSTCSSSPARRARRRPGAAAADAASACRAAVAAAIPSELDALSAPAPPPARRRPRSPATRSSSTWPSRPRRWTRPRRCDGARRAGRARTSSRPTEVPRRFRFRHPLVRRAVYEACPPGARLARARALRRRAGGARRAGRGAGAPRRARRAARRPRGGRGAARGGRGAAGRAPASAARWFGIALAAAAGRRAGRRAGRAADRARRSAAPRPGASRTAATALLESIALDARGGRARCACGSSAPARALEQLLGHHEAARTPADRGARTARRRGLAARRWSS